jgi:hypothetical protein
MPFRSLPTATPSFAMPNLTSREWRDVQRAVRAVQGSACPHGELPGRWHRGLARISQIMPGLRTRETQVVSPELEPLRDFLCESARHGPKVDILAEQLEQQGYSSAQIAALSFIAG